MFFKGVFGLVRAFLCCLGVFGVSFWVFFGELGLGVKGLGV